MRVFFVRFIGYNLNGGFLLNKANSLLLFLILFFPLVPLPSIFAADEGVYLGAAKVEITPPVGTTLAGYGKRRGKPSTAVHDPLFARAVALKRGTETLVFVSADLVLIDEELRQAALKKIRRTTSLRDEQFMLFATHTHSGAGAVGGRFWERFIMGKFRREVFEKVTDGIAGAVLESLEENIPVTAEYGETRIDGLVENRMDEKLDAPDRLKILRFKETGGKVVGLFLFMAAHPTILPASNLEISADFPGVVTRLVEKDSPEAVALFMNGAAADLRPKTGEFENRFDRMEAYGFALAEEVKKISLGKVSFDGPWQGKIQKVKLPRTKIRKGWLRAPSWLGNRFFPRKSYFQAARLGRFLFLAFPGEIGSEIGRDIERGAQARFLTPLFAGFANDYIAYVIPRRYYRDQSHYESQASFYGPKIDWFVQKQADLLMDSLLTAEEREISAPRGGMVYKEGLPVLKLQGDPYWLGHEEGRLLKKEIRRGMDDIFRYLRSELPLPLFNRLLIHYSISRAWRQMEPFVSYDEYQQMKGIAEGSGISFRKIRYLHALPEVYPTWCTNGAYWGPATRDGRLIAIRNLDWNRKMGIHRHAAVKFIHTPGQKKYVNIGYYGFAGVLSGMNESGISVGQIGAASADETMKGVPMPFLLKRVLEESDSVEDAVTIFKRSDRTRGYNYVIADARRKEAVVLETTRHHIALFRDNDPAESSIPYALRVENAVFRGDPALDPAIRDLQLASKGDPKKTGLEMPAGSAYEIRYRKHGELVQKNYGRIDPEMAKSMAREIAPGSNIQSVIYAFPDFWVANAKDDLKAAETEYVRFHWDE